MRQVIDHIVSGDQAAQLRIDVVDGAAPDGADHAYMVSGFSTVNNSSEDYLVRAIGDGPGGSILPVLFQKGPIGECGVNGITQEALLAIVIDRLRSFQLGPFSCRENAIALTHCEDALMWLQRRTVTRIKRGVEA